MPTVDPARYEQRSVEEWLRMAERGKLALPTFQRSYVWNNKESIANYLRALFQNRPTGLFLTLKTENDPQFSSRTLKGLRVKPREVTEQLLDGQQRLTSLWRALNGRATTYYAQVDDFNADRIAIEDIRWAVDQSERRAFVDPEQAYSRRLVPLTLLRNAEEGPKGDRPIWDWCHQARPGDPNAAWELHAKIIAVRNKFLGRSIRYCELPATTSPDEAIDIFVQSNKSSAKVTEFDIAVALATDKGDGHEDLRERLSVFYEHSDTIPNYIPAKDDDLEPAIAPLGEWMLIAGCLTTGLDPKKQQFETLIRKLFADSTAAAQQQLARLLKSIEAALETLAAQGAPTKLTLPTLPAVHVLAALNDRLQPLYEGKSDRQRLTRGLMNAYIWRAFVTNRYEARANDRLHDDFRKLRTCLEQISRHGNFDRTAANLPPIFNDDTYPVPGQNDLGALAKSKPIPWIRSPDRLGRAIASIALHNNPIDWATGDKLTPSRVRQLEAASTLHRHHIFPKALLREHNINDDSINHGLNGILLSKPSNNTFWRLDPQVYLTSVLEGPACPTETDLRAWVESHLVPYDAIMAKGTVSQRYRGFIRQRAIRIAAKLKELTQLPT